MSERVDRSIGSSGLILIMVLAVLILTVIGIVVWLRMTSASPPSLIQSGQVPVRTPRPDEPLVAKLYAPERGALRERLVPLKRQPDAQAQAREALNALLGDSNFQFPVLKDLKLRGFFLEPSGTGYVDLLVLDHEGIRVSAGEELLALSAIINSLTVNFEEIKQIRFLIEGREAQTLGGHIDLSRTFRKRPDLVKQ